MFSPNSLSFNGEAEAFSQEGSIAVANHIADQQRADEETAKLLGELGDIPGANIPLDERMIITRLIRGRYASLAIEDCLD